MNPATIIQQAAADGVNLALSHAGTIKAIGGQAAVNRWLPLIREHKPGIVAALSHQRPIVTPRASTIAPDERGVCGAGVMSPAAEARRQRVLAILAERPDIRYALITDDRADPEAVILVLAIHGRATCEMRIPRAKYDPFLLLNLIAQHGATVH